MKIKVISQDKSKIQDYIINVTKTDDFQLANTNLEILAIENSLLIPHFDNTITHYNTQVSSDTKNLNVFAVPENENGKVEILGKDNINVGNNKVSIIVTAPNGVSKRVYEVNVYKRNEQEQELYNNEQNKIIEKLEQAYEIEKTSLPKDNNQIEQKQDNNFVLIFCIVVGALISVIGGIFYLKNKRE